MGNVFKTRDKDVNQVLAAFRKIGWHSERKPSGVLAFVPPPEVAAANPDKPKFVHIHITPSDRRAAANYKAVISSYVDPRPNKGVREKIMQSLTFTDTVQSYFCQECGPQGPTFPSPEARDRHKMTEHIKTPDDPEAEPAEAVISKAQIGFSAARQCPFCPWNKTGKAMRRHMEKEHAAGYKRIRGDLLTLEGLEAAREGITWGQDEAVTQNITDPGSLSDLVFGYLYPDGLTVTSVDQMDALIEARNLIASLEELATKKS